MGRKGWAPKRGGRVRPVLEEKDGTIIDPVSWVIFHDVPLLLPYFL